MMTIVFFSLVFCMVFSNLGGTAEIEREVVPVVIDHEAEIRDVLEKENVDPYVAELLIAQSKHESGNYKNSLTKYHNVFARHYHKNDSFAISAGATAEGHSRFAIYPSLKNATLSQLSYLKRKKYSFRWNSPKQFAVELKSKGYYEATVEEYTDALNRFVRK